MKGDEQGIVDLLEKAFNGWPSHEPGCPPLDHWRWKYRDDDIRTRLICVALHEDEIVGVKHAVPLKVKLLDETRPCGIGSDVAVHRKMRATGIRNKITAPMDRMKKEYGLQYIYSITSNPVAIKILSKTQSLFPVTLTNLTRIKDIDHQLQAMPMKNAWLMKQGYRGTKLLNTIRNLALKPEKTDEETQVRDVTCFDERINEFYEAAKDHYDFIVERSMEYLNWRHCDPRAGDFTVKQAEDTEGNIQGYTILATTRSKTDYPVGCVVDMMTLPDRYDVADLLLQEATDFFDGQDVNIAISLIVQDTPYMKIYQKHGFLNSRIQPKMFYYPLTDKDEFKKLRNTPPRRIHFSYGDVDSLPSKLPQYI